MTQYDEPRDSIFKAAYGTQQQRCWNCHWSTSESISGNSPDELTCVMKDEDVSIGGICDDWTLQDPEEKDD